MQTPVQDNFAALKIEGYLDMPEIYLPIFHEKKAGTSVNEKSPSYYPVPIPPPPIRPMVEKHPIIEIPGLKYGTPKPIEECL